MTDDEFLNAFENCTLTRAEWTHEAHVRMAWLYCRREQTTEAALAKMRAGIPRLNAALGTAPELYHETVTSAFGTAVHRRASKPDATGSWPEFRATNPDLFNRENPILQTHYSPETLQSEAARLSFVAPDRTPL